MDDDITTYSSPFAEFNRRTFFGIVLIAGISSLITITVAKLLNQFVIAPALCGSAAETVCTNSISVSFHIASIIAAIAAVAMLVNLSVYRPLLVVLAAMIGSWGMYNQPFPLINLPWYLQMAMIFFVNALAFLAFAWILRSYNMAVGVALTLLVTALMIIAIIL